MPRSAFTSKESAALIGLKDASKASQAMQPAWEKVARHWRLDPERTLLTILHWPLDPMTDREQALREAMLEGRLDRKVLHP